MLILQPTLLTSQISDPFSATPVLQLLYQISLKSNNNKLIITQKPCVTFIYLHLQNPEVTRKSTPTPGFQMQHVLLKNHYKEQLFVLVSKLNFTTQIAFAQKY